jgi:hypothetical protein
MVVQGFQILFLAAQLIMLAAAAVQLQQAEQQAQAELVAVETVV